MKEEEKKYYVYIYLDPEKPGKFVYRFKGKILRTKYEPFYVGKGSGWRYTKSFYLNQIKNTFLEDRIRVIQQSKFLKPIVKFKKNFSEKEAYKLEKILIEGIGRKITKEGPLVNLIEGRLGKGIFPKKIREKISSSGKKAWENSELRRKNASKMMKSANEMFFQNPEFRKKNSEKAIKRWQDPIIGEKLRKAVIASNKRRAKKK